MKLLLVIPCLKDELVNFRDTLLESLLNFNKEFEEISAFIVVQGQGNEHNPADIFEYIRPQVTIFDECVSWKNASKARNMGIVFAKENNYTHIVFHDIALFYPITTCKFFRSKANVGKSVKVKAASKHSKE